MIRTIRTCCLNTEGIRFSSNLKSLFNDDDWFASVHLSHTVLSPDRQPENREPENSTTFLQKFCRTGSFPPCAAARHTSHFSPEILQNMSAEPNMSSNKHPAANTNTHTDTTHSHTHLHTHTHTHTHRFSLSNIGCENGRSQQNFLTRYTLKSLHIFQDVLHPVYGVSWAVSLKVRLGREREQLCFWRENTRTESAFQNHGFCWQ